MNKYICISLFIVGIMGFYSVAFAEDCNLTVKCVCESNSLRMVQCPDFLNSAIDCTQGTCAVDCGQGIAASCEEIPIECRNNETKNCLVTLPVKVGTSTISCPSGLTACSGQCVDLSNNEANCGLCDNPCATEEMCISGVCETSVCSPGQTDCAGQCVDLSNNNGNCGACGNACNADSLCIDGNCQFGIGAACAAPFECVSGNCVDGFCCETACDEACVSCDVGGAEGSCMINAGGIQGSPTCDPYVCNGKSATCPKTCTTDADCVISYYCLSNECVPR